MERVPTRSGHTVSYPLYVVFVPVAMDLRRVMLVEPSPDRDPALVEFLRRHYDVRVVGDDGSALDVASEWDPDVVIVVMVSPDQVSLAEQLRDPLATRPLLIAVGAEPADGWQLVFDYWFDAGTDPRELHAVVSAWSGTQPR